MSEFARQLSENLADTICLNQNLPESRKQKMRESRRTGLLTC